MLQKLSLVDIRKSHDPSAALDIVIIGGGATGVELAAELREASSLHAQYGLRHIDASRDVRIRILEGAPRLLAPLAENVSAAATRLLRQRHVEVNTSCRVVRVDDDRVTDADGIVYPADLCVWAAGIKAPPLLGQVGLPVNRGGQVTVDGQLRVEGVAGVFAFGDCAFCPQPGGRSVPPRAQSAHQQADYLYSLLQQPASTDLGTRPPYLFHDHGSLVSIGSSATVGSLMGNLFKSTTWFVEGLFARMVYVSLHLMHHRAVMGLMRTAVLAMARFLVKRARPLVKLH
jgi:NADH dehydrogenase